MNKRNVKVIFKESNYSSIFHNIKSEKIFKSFPGSTRNSVKKWPSFSSSRAGKNGFGYRIEGAGSRIYTHTREKGERNWRTYIRRYK